MGEGQNRKLDNGYGISPGGDENELQLDDGDGCPTM